MANPVEGSGGFSEAILQNSYGTARVSQHGAHVLDYTPAGGRPVLWISDEAVYRTGKAIRGGIPVCWPWFADHPTDADKPAHGVARQSEWEFADISADAATLRLVDSDYSRSLWPQAFELTLSVTLAEQLTVSLTAHNRDAAPMRCTAALHTYFAISNVAEIEICGLEDCSYIDSIDQDARKVQKGPIEIGGEVDRIYLNTAGETVINDSGWDRSIKIGKSGSNSTVVWNPWIEKAQRMGDFGDDEFRSMVCIETTNAADDVIEIPPGESHTLTTLLSST